MGTMGICATSSCNLFVPLGPTWVWSHIYYFHLMMDCYCACPTLWLSGSDSTKFIMSSSGHMEFDGLWLSIQFQLRPNSKPKAVFKNRNSYPQKMVGLCSKILSLQCDSPVGACQKIQRASLFAPLDLLDLAEHHPCNLQDLNVALISAKYSGMQYCFFVLFKFLFCFWFTIFLSRGWWNYSFSNVGYITLCICQTHRTLQSKKWTYCMQT